MTPKPFNKREPRTPTGSAHGEQPIVNRKADAALRQGSTPPPGSNSLKNDATGYAHLGAQVVRMWGLK